MVTVTGVSVLVGSPSVGTWGERYKVARLCLTHFMRAQVSENRRGIWGVVNRFSRIGGASSCAPLVRKQFRCLKRKMEDVM